VVCSCVAHIEQIREEDAQGALAKVYGAASERAGEVANILKVMSQDAAVLQGSMALYINLMKSRNALSARRREMLAAVVSNINDCYY
jgi:alkylhydroperoxidase family enzyme